MHLVAMEPSTTKRQCKGVRGCAFLHPGRASLPSRGRDHGDRAAATTRTALREDVGSRAADRHGCGRGGVALDAVDLAMAGNAALAMSPDACDANVCCGSILVLRQRCVADAAVVGDAAKSGHDFDRAIATFRPDRLQSPHESLHIFSHLCPRGSPLREMCPRTHWRAENSAGCDPGGTRPSRSES